MNGLIIFILVVLGLCAAALLFVIELAVVSGALVAGLFLT